MGVDLEAEGYTSSPTFTRQPFNDSLSDSFESLKTKAKPRRDRKFS